ncbi:MAG: hypothetical protein MI702_05275 [Chlorobiales bacterium]|nr:hypothetical protein [Chlorobiales bacterium]
MENNDNAIEPDRLSTNLRIFHEQMSSESDRGSVIVSVALLDEILSNMLKERLAPSLEKSDELFDSAFSPFSTFSAKIDLAYRIGLLRPSIRSSLHLLRKVRNNFAHASDYKGFDHQSTQSRIRELIKLNKLLLATIIDVVNDAVPAEGVDRKLEGMDDFIKVMGWRGILQMIFATLACGLAEPSPDSESIKPLIDLD